MWTAVAALGLLLGLSGCGQAVGVPGTSPASGAVSPSPAEGSVSALVPDGYDGSYLGVGLVLEEAGTGPQLCLGGAAASLPPQCGGPVVDGWRWDALPAGSYEEVGGVRWGSFAVTGTYDGERVALTRPAEVPAPGDARDRPSPDFSAPCAEPDGGWPSSGSWSDLTGQQDALQQASAVAGAVDGFGALWLDRRETVVGGSATADPGRLVLVVTTTGDLAEMEQQVRGAWDGALCVAPAVRTEAELRRVQEAVAGMPGLLEAGTDSVRGVVEVRLVHARQSDQVAVDAEYGPGVVELTSALLPARPD